MRARSFLSYVVACVLTSGCLLKPDGPPIIPNVPRDAAVSDAAIIHCHTGPASTTLGGSSTARSYSWQPPMTGRYEISTSGSADTLLEVRDGATVIASDDDSGEGANARVTIEVRACATFSVRVDFYSGRSGSYTVAVVAR